MADRFYFNPTTKTYLPSGTTVLPSPDLMQWSANCAADYLLDSKHKIESATGEPTALSGCAFENSRFAYLRLSTEAADYGTYIHTLCQHCLENDIEIESPHELTQGFMDGLWAWKLKHKVKVITMEAEVLSRWYGGRLDLVCEMNSFWMTKAWCKRHGVEWYEGIEKQRVIVLVDFKTGKSSYYETWKYQLSGYRAAWNEGVCCDCSPKSDIIACRMCDHPRIQHQAILKFNKKTGKVNFKPFDIYEATRTVQDGKMVNGKLPTEKYIRTYETDRATFMACVALWWATKRGIEI